MFTTEDLFFKLVDMEFSLKGLLARLRALSKAEETMEWTTLDGKPTVLKLKRHIQIEEDVVMVLWEIKEWE